LRGRACRASATRRTADRGAGADFSPRHTPGIGRHRGRRSTRRRHSRCSRIRRRSGIAPRRL
jgi:hypothetical protein